MKIAIVGAGIAGMSTAWALTARGHDVTLIEQGPIPNPLAASGDHHRIIRRAYGPGSGYGRAITEAYEAWDALWADLGTSHYDPRGFICVSREEGDDAEQYLEGMKAGGFVHELFTPAEAAERWPFLDAGSMRFVFHSPEGGALHCRRIAAGMADWLSRNGATVLEHTRVVSVDPEEGRLQLERGDSIVADRVVVTAGAWVPKLFPKLVADLTTYRTAVVYLEPPADLKAAWEKAPVILDVGGETDGYIIPPTGGAGLKFGSGLHKEATDDPSANRAPRPSEGDKIRNLFGPPIARIEDYAVKETLSCACTFTEDERFFAHEAGRALVVSACSGHGYKFGAAVGRRVADAVEGCDMAALGRWLRAEAA